MADERGEARELTDADRCRHCGDHDHRSWQCQDFEWADNEWAETNGGER